jgi:hypothetical protein
MNREEEPFMTMIAAQAEADAAFLGSVLRCYSKAEHLSDEGLAVHLGVHSDALTGLRLCLRPRHEHFIADLDAISTRYRVSASVLGSVIRLVEALEVMRANDVTPADHGLLMAARTRPGTQANNSVPCEERPGIPPTPGDEDPRTGEDR